MTKNKNKGFTLIELMIVITVIAILAAIVLFGLGAAQKNARDVQRVQIMKSMQIRNFELEKAINSKKYPRPYLKQVYEFSVQLGMSTRE